MSNRIAKVRQARGMTQEQVARAADLALNTIKALEATGRGHVTSLRKVADVLGVGLDDLLEEPDEVTA